MTGERLNAERRCIAVRNADVRVNLRFNAIALALSVTLAGVAGTALPATAQAQTAPEQQQFSIPAGTLREALDALASQSGITVMSSQSSEEHTSELQSLMRISYAVFCLPK